MLGIIGGTGIGDALFEGADAREHEIETPFGQPSSPVRVVRWEGAEIAVLARHGEGHVHPPSAVPYRANVFALKKLGVTHLLTTGAVGSLREEMKPKDLVLVDQIVDRTYRRVPTFFEEGMAVHVELAEPYCPALRMRIAGVATDAPGQEGGATVHPRGTYVCIEGPSFSTRAEASMHRAMGADVVGMTAMPEARLAREAEMCAALVAFPTDFDCWRPRPESTPKEALLAEILENVHQATANALALLRGVARDLARAPGGACACHAALALGIWTRRDRLEPEVVRRYGPLVSRYFPESA
jgi:5'-methylthioadenosine phosphorylase